MTLLHFLELNRNSSLCRSYFSFLSNLSSFHILFLLKAPFKAFPVFKKFCEKLFYYRITESQNVRALSIEDILRKEENNLANSHFNV